MDCLHPISIPNPDYGNDASIESGPTISCPCGKCEACIISNANEWRTRLQIEMDNSENAYFITLTYDDTKIPVTIGTDSFGERFVVPSVSKRDIQLFFKRLRKNDPERKIRYFLVSEYGPTTLRPHYHGIVYNLPCFSKDSTKQIVYVTKYIQKVWSNGNVKVDLVTYGRISYVTKYMSCVTDLPEHYPPPFRLMSRRPGIGSSYLEKHQLVNWHRQNLANYYPQGSFKSRLPRYLKDKIFDDEMKSEIADIMRYQRQQKEFQDVDKAFKLGYKNFVEYRHSMIEKHVRKFNSKHKKSRKDI